MNALSETTVRTTRTDAATGRAQSEPSTADHAPDRPGGRLPAGTTIHRFDAVESRLTEAEDRAALFADRAFRARLSDRLDTLAQGRDILSLDVFDTLLLRDRSSEISRFHEIGAAMAEIAEARLGRAVRPVDAFLARHLGTKATYRAAPTAQGCREGSLIELHRTASRLLAGDDSLAEAFVAAELDHEQARLAPNPALAAHIDRFRKRGGQVILITDMYMHAEHVADLLERHGIAPHRYDRLFSSADTRVSKATGRIFPLVEEKLGRPPGAFVHVGDSLRGDFVNPVRRGWAALHLPLGAAEVSARRADHIATAAALEERFGLSVDIALPK